MDKTLRCLAQLHLHLRLTQERVQLVLLGARIDSAALVEIRIEGVSSFELVGLKRGASRFIDAVGVDGGKPHRESATVNHAHLALFPVRANRGHDDHGCPVPALELSVLWLPVDSEGVANMVCRYPFGAVLLHCHDGVGGARHRDSDELGTHLILSLVSGIFLRLGVPAPGLFLCG